MIRTFLHYLRYPTDHDRLDILKQRWSSLPEHLQTADQSLGRYNTGCGATHGVHEACNFGCTACYLGSDANQQKPMPLAEVTAQLDDLRRLLGPGANVQITSGEVTLLPADHLAAIVRHAVQLRLSPMVMTHGDILLHNPAYLETLVDAGLEKVSFHVDITQRGRIGWGREDSEAALNQVRDQCADLLRSTTRRTGRGFKAATTMTVNKHNIHQLDAPIQWFMKRGNPFRLMSFQPEATTGRTRAGKGVSAAAVWAALEASLGLNLDPHTFRFGHPDCNRIAVIMLLEGKKRTAVLPVVRAGNRKDRHMAGQVLGNFAGISLAGTPPLEGAARILGMLARRPVFAARLIFHGLKRLLDERRQLPLMLGVLLGRTKPRLVSFIVHAFMDAEALTTPEGQERLDACAFKLAVDGELVSMCQMNGGAVRDKTYQDRQAVPV